MLNIVVPMAGRGRRFQEAGYTMPKPLIPIHGTPMIQLVIENIRPNCHHRFIFLCLQEHLDTYDLAERLNAWAPGCIIVPVSTVTEGAACTVLLAREFIDSSDPLMIANSDQWVDVDIDEYLRILQLIAADGLIMTMRSHDPKCSYIRLDEKDQTIEIVEKQVVSDHATVGVYNFAHGSDFVAAAVQMILSNKRVNGEFYVAPVYNELLAAGKRITYLNIGAEYVCMHCLGTPKDLDRFLISSLSQKALGRIAPIAT